MRSFSIPNAISIESPEGWQIGQKWAKFHQIYKFSLFSQKVFDVKLLNRIKWSTIIPPFSSLNAISIELPKGGQKWAKIHKFYKLCLFSQKLFDEFLSNCNKWRPIMSSFSIQNAILIELPSGVQIGQKRQKFTNFTYFAYFHKNCLMNFYLIAPIEDSSWGLFPSKMPFWITWRWANWAKAGKISPNLQILPIFSKTVWWNFFKSHKMKDHNTPFLQP